MKRMQAGSTLRALAGVIAVSVSFAVAAQEYPVRPVRLIVPYATGGIVDLMARAISDGLSSRLKQPVVVEPRPGGNASIGTDAVARAEPDGHTLLLATLALTVTPHLNKVPWDPIQDFAGVAHVGIVANVAAAHPSLGVSDLRSFIALAKSRPGSINYVNAGNGSSPHVSAELLQQNTGITLTSINYKGIAPAITDFLGGAVQFGFFPFGTIAPHIRSGKAIALGIASPVRDKQFPNIPTMTEQGLGDSQVNSWFAVVVPKKTPRRIVQRLNNDINATLGDASVVARVETIGGTVIAGWTPQQTDQMIAEDFARWKKFTVTAGIEAK